MQWLGVCGGGGSDAALLRFSHIQDITHKGVTRPTSWVGRGSLDAVCVCVEGEGASRHPPSKGFRESQCGVPETPQYVLPLPKPAAWAKLDKNI